MKFNTSFELVKVADEYMAVPTGKKADDFHGIIVLSEPAYFLLSNMKEHKTKEDLVTLIIDEYEIDAATAQEDIDGILGTLLEAGVIDE